MALAMRVTVAISLFGNLLYLAEIGDLIQSVRIRHAIASFPSDGLTGLVSTMRPNATFDHVISIISQAFVLLQQWIRPLALVFVVLALFSYTYSITHRDRTPPNDSSLPAAVTFAISTSSLAVALLLSLATELPLLDVAWPLSLISIYMRFVLATTAINVGKLFQQQATRTMDQSDGKEASPPSPATTALSSSPTSLFASILPSLTRSTLLLPIVVIISIELLLRLVATSLDPASSSLSLILLLEDATTPMSSIELQSRVSSWMQSIPLWSRLDTTLLQVPTTLARLATMLCHVCFFALLPRVTRPGPPILHAASFVAPFVYMSTLLITSRNEAWTAVVLTLLVALFGIFRVLVQKMNASSVSK